ALRCVLTRLVAPVREGLARPAAAMRALAETLEAIASGPEGGLGDLWGGQAGESLAALTSEVLAGSDALPDVTPAGFRDLLDGLLARERLRPGGASHPRLRILGVLEARMLRADVLVLAG